MPSSLFPAHPQRLRRLGGGGAHDIAHVAGGSESGKPAALGGHPLNSTSSNHSSALSSHHAGCTGTPFSSSGNSSMSASSFSIIIHFMRPVGLNGVMVAICGGGETT